MELTFGGARPDEALTAELAWSDVDRPETRELLDLSVPAEGSRREISVPDGVRALTVEARAGAYWSRPRLVELPLEEPLRIALWPASRLVARPLPPDGEEAITEVSVMMQPVPLAERRSRRAQPGEPVELLCPVHDGRIDCAAPAGEWNLHLRAEPSAPRIYWRRSLPSERPLDLGEARFARGATLAGRVVTEDGPVSLSSSSLEVRPKVVAHPALGDTAREELTLLRAPIEIDASGHFEIRGVPSGVYELEARQEGYAPARRTHVHLTAGAAVVLDDPLTLRAARTLTVAVSPPADFFDRPWEIALEPDRGSDSLPRDRGTTDVGGLWTSRPIPEGRYVAWLLDHEGEVVQVRPLEVGGGHRVVDFELDLVWLEGSVVRGETPVPGRVTLRDLDEGSAVSTPIDEEGSFAMALPRPGTWHAEIHSDDPPIRSGTLEVSVEPTSEDLRFAEVTIELPDTEVVGSVVDTFGSPAPDASVYLLSDDREQLLRITTRFDGSFEAHGMPPGQYFVEAKSGTRLAEPVAITIAEDLSTSTRLVLHESRPMAGRVSHGGAPVPHARVQALPTTASGIATFLPPDAQTDVSGLFRMRLPARTAGVTLIIQAPGYPLTVRRVAEGSSLDIRLPSDRGTLRVIDRVGSPTEARALVLMVAGQALPLSILSDWARTNGVTPHGDQISVPAMPPGAYSLCALTPSEASWVLAGGALPSADLCTDGFLTAGGELALQPVDL